MKLSSDQSSLSYFWCTCLGWSACLGRGVFGRPFALLLLIGLLLPLTTHSASWSNSLPQLDLTHFSSVNLTEIAEVVVDEKQSLTYADVHQENWQRLGREQLKFGFTDAAIWLRFNFEAIGQGQRLGIFVFNKNIDSVKTYITVDGSPISPFHSQAIDNALFDDFSAHKLHTPHSHSTLDKNDSDIYALNQPQITRSERNDFKTSITDHANHPAILLQPGSTYSVVIRLESQNTINGQIQLHSENVHINNSHNQLMGYLAYIIVVLMILLINTMAYLTTRLKVFLYHSLYGVSMLVFQMSQYGYVNTLLGSDSAWLRQKLIVFSLGIIALSVVLFIDKVLESARHAPRLANAHRVIFYAIVLSILATLFLPHYTSVMLLVCCILAIVVASATYLFWASLNHFAENRFAHYLSIMYALLVPPTLLLMMSRYGLIEQSFITEYLLLLLTPVEMLGITLILFFHMRRIDEKALTATFYNAETALPNASFLRQKLEANIHQMRNMALVQIRLAGLTEVELVLGAERFSEYSLELVKRLNKRLGDLEFVIDGSEFGHQRENRRHQGSTSLYLIGKNKFALIIDNNNRRKLNKVQQLIKKLIGEMQQDYNIHSVVFSYVAACPVKEPAMQVSKLLQGCELALAHCIKTKQEQTLYEPLLGEMEQRQAILSSEFKQAIDHNHLFLEWQPQFGSKDNKICGLESLVRWKHPTFGVIRPEEFIPMLEDSRQIKKLTHWVIQSVFRELINIRQHFPNINLSINLSVYDLLDDELMSVVDRYLTINPDLSKNITLEVTESVMMHDENRVLYVVDELKTRGFSISIDDFGAGYASFGHLQKIPANELKIDQRYTSSCREKNSQIIIKSIIKLARQLGMDVVVEGIEKQYQVDLFKKWGNVNLQGWKLARPMHIDDVIREFA